ncbi:MAG: hypothetical protein ACYTGZ_02620 [Planctomycetota bacterium]|jgi:methyl-accepting chemotaxis protein
MEPKSAKESIVSRLFGFGRKHTDEPETAAETAATGPDGRDGERGFARTEESPKPDANAAAEDPKITIPEQVIRIRSGGVRKRDEVIGAIGDSFKELTSLLGSVSDRLDRQDSRSSDLADQLKEMPDYLRQLPELHAEQNEIARRTVDALTEIPVAQREQAAAVHGLADRLADKVGEGTEAMRGVADVVSKIPEEMRNRADVQQAAMQELTDAQRQTARVIHHGNQKQLNVFHQATQKTLQTVNLSVKSQRRDMEQILLHSEANMKRMLILTASFMAAALIAVVAVLWFR